MFGFGDFARHGRVSVRMLRHYDAIGILKPARVDPLTGYRSYDAGQSRGGGEDHPSTGVEQMSDNVGKGV